MNEYEVTQDGVQLLGGRTWQEHDHLNVRTESGTTNYHAEAKCGAAAVPPECSPIMQDAAQRIGADFIPWSALGIDESSCVEWVQFSRANYHFGEQGEEALCLTVVPPIEPPEVPPVLPPVEPPVELPECPEHKVPGWLDENGDPQGCVDNNPTPLEPKPEPELPQEPSDPVESAEVAVPAAQPQQLAETGADAGLGVVLALALVAAGVGATFFGKLRRR